MAELSSTKTLLNWIYSTAYEDIPSDVRQLAKLAIYDGIGSNLACSLLPVAHRTVNLVKSQGGVPACSMIGFSLRTSARNAALVNGTLGHADEVDAIEGDGFGAHLLAAIMAAALTAGQTAGAPGREVIRAVVLGYELSKRAHIAAAGVHAQREAGRTPGAIDAGNTMGSVAAAGISLGLSPDQMDRALSLGAIRACGITPFARETEHMLKSLVRGGLGAENGVTAALMTTDEVNYEAPRDIFDGPQGFFDARLGVEPGSEFVAGLGEEYSIRGITFKRRCAGGPNQAPSQALLDIMSENGLAADDIGEITVEVDPAGFNTITSVHHPSIYGKTVMALAVVYRGMGFREAHQEACYKSPQVLSMEERINIQARQDWTGHRSFHTAVTVTTKDGRTFQKETDYRPMTEEDLDEKFAYLVGLRAGETKAREVAQVLKQLDTVDNIADVMVQLELPEASIDQV